LDDAISLNEVLMSADPREDIALLRFRIIGEAINPWLTPAERGHLVRGHLVPEVSQNLTPTDEGTTVRCQPFGRACDVLVNMLANVAHRGEAGQCCIELLDRFLEGLQASFNLGGKCGRSPQTARGNHMKLRSTS
jgi:hypothetical protein